MSELVPYISIDLIRVQLSHKGYYLQRRPSRSRQQNPGGLVKSSAQLYPTTYGVYSRETRQQVIKFSSKETLIRWIKFGCPLENT